MKRTNGIKATDGTLLLCTLQAGFGCAAVFNVLKEAYLWLSIVLCHHRLVSFAEER